jgi:hypothetical protein
MAEDGDKHVVDGVKQLLFEGVGNISVEHVSFKGLVILPVELRDLYCRGGGREVRSRTSSLY